MAVFSDKEADALRQIEKINREMRSIMSRVEKNNGMIDHRNKQLVGFSYIKVERYLEKYENIKTKMSEMERGLLMGADVIVWNGEKTGALMWEMYINNVMPRLFQDIKNA